MPRDLVTIATFANSAEASPARTRLEEAGIPTYLHGGVTSDVLSYFGTAVAGVTLQVAAEDVERTMQCLDDLGTDQTETAAPWSCAKCGTHVDGGYEVCWSCGTTIDESETLRARGVTAPEHDQSSEAAPRAAPCPMCGADVAADARDCPNCGEPLDAEDIAPAAGAAVEPDEEVPDQILEAEEILRRAYRAAILGVGLCPPTLNVYSAMQLAEYNRRRAEYDGKIAWRLVVAWLLNAAVFIAAFAALIWILGPEER